MPQFQQQKHFEFIIITNLFLMYVNNNDNNKIIDNFNVHQGLHFNIVFVKKSYPNKFLLRL